MTISKPLAIQNLRRAIDAHGAYIAQCAAAEIPVDSTVDHHLCKYIEIAIGRCEAFGATPAEVNAALS